MKHPSTSSLVIDAIESWDPLHGPLTWSDSRFDALAMRVFGHQFEGNEPFRRFCQSRGVTPENASTYRDIPAVPTDVFKHVRLTSAQTIARTFLTSGTTHDARGAHHFQTLDVYEAAIWGPFQRFCNPQDQKMRLLVIHGSPAQMPESSLSYMLGKIVDRWGDDKSAFFVKRARTDFDALSRALDEAQDEGVTTMVLGTAFGFVEFLDHTPVCWQLPEGSRVMETGGLKGRTRTVTREELYAGFEDRLGIAPSKCISEYSMTELSSQAYTDVLTTAPDAPPRLRVPPWVRIQIVDPLTLHPLDAPATPGLIRWIDLANVDSVCAIQTSDLGTADPDGGFVLHGRAPDSELRGCSLTIEDLLEAARA